MGTAKGAQLEGATPHPRAVPGTGSTPPLPPSHPVSHAHLLPMEPQMGWPPLPEPVTEPQRGHQSREELQFPEATLSPSWAPPSQLFAWGEWRPGEQETHPRPYREWGLCPASAPASGEKESNPAPLADRVCGGSAWLRSSSTAGGTHCLSLSCHHVAAILPPPPHVCGCSWQPEQAAEARG